MIFRTWGPSLSVDQICLRTVQVPLLLPEDLAQDTEGIASVRTGTRPRALRPQATTSPEPAREAIPTPGQLV